MYTHVVLAILLCYESSLLVSLLEIKCSIPSTLLQIMQLIPEAVKTSTSLSACDDASFLFVTKREVVGSLLLPQHTLQPVLLLATMLSLLISPLNCSQA